MDTKQKTSVDVGTLMIVLANLGPLLGVLFGDWTAFEVVFVYWLENLILGFYTALRMTIKPDSGLIFIVGSAFMALFFVGHYGLFCYVHGMLVTGLLGDQLATINSNDLSVITSTLLEKEALKMAVLGIFIAHGIDYLRSYWKRDIGSARQEMMRPYSRMIVLHIALIFGGFVAIAFGNALGVMLLMIAFKIFSDIKQGAKKHGETSKSATASSKIDELIAQIESAEGHAEFELNGNRMSFDSFKDMQQSPQYQQMLKWARLFISKKDIQRIESALEQRIAREEGISGVVLDGEASTIEDDAKRVEYIPRDKA